MVFAFVRSAISAALRRKEGRIGFDQHAVQRDDTGRADNPVSGGIGDGTGKRDIETSRERFGGERRIAAETVKDAFDARELVEDREQVGKGIPGMEDDRLADLLGEPQHLPKDASLGRCRRPVGLRVVIIETDLPHRDHRWMTRQLAQLMPLRGADGGTGGVRVAADRGSQAGDLFGKPDALTVVAPVVADVDHHLNADVLRVGQRLGRGQRFAQMKEVRMRIDQATGSGFSIRGNRTPASAVCVRGASLPQSRTVAQGAFGSAFTCAAIFEAVSGRNGEIK